MFIYWFIYKKQSRKHVCDTDGWWGVTSGHNPFPLFLFSSIPVVPTPQAWQLLLFQVPLDSTRLSTANPLGGSMACYPPQTVLSMIRCWCRRWSPSYPTSAWSSCGVRRLQLAVTGNYQDWTLLKTGAESLHSFTSIMVNIAFLIFILIWFQLCLPTDVIY